MVSIVQSVFFIALILVLISSFLITSLFRFKNIIPYLLTIYLLTFANILFSTELAGLFGLLNSRFFILLVHFVILLISFLIWKRLGAPPLFSPLSYYFKKTRSTNLWKYCRNHPTLILLGFISGASLLLSAILILEIPPNNYDAMTCHMARVGYWLQHGDFSPWPTWFTLQTEYPINAQLQILWSVLFWRTDKFAGFVQWFAAIISMITIYGIARLSNKNCSQALFASFIFSLFPQVLLQSTSAQPHLLGSALVIIAFYFLFLGFRERSKFILTLSGLSIGIAIGVHLIVIFLLPGYAITALFLTIKYRRDKYGAFQWIFISSLVSFFLFSSFIYIQNLVYYKYPLGSFAEANPWSPINSSEVGEQESYWIPKNLIKNTFTNTSKYMFASYDLTGLPDNIIEPFYRIRDVLFIPFFEKTKIPLHHGEFNIDVRVPAISENWAWFGMVGFVLFYPLILFETITAIKKKDSVRITLISNILLYALIWSGLIARENGWSMYSGRYFVPGAMLFAPLIAVVYQKAWWSKVLCGFLVLASCVIAYQTMLNNYAKPLKDHPSIFTWNRADKIFAVSREQQPVYRAIDAYVPRGTLGLLLTPSLMEYPYFGEYFHRTLIPIYPYDKVNDQLWLQDQQIDWILSCVDIDATPEGFEIIETVVLDPPVGISDACSIYKRQ